MRTAYAMADHTTPDILGAALGAAATATAGVLGWLGLRAQGKKPQADPQAVQNEGWTELLDQMRLELKAASSERNHLNAVLEEERRTWRAQQEVWAKERVVFTGEIAQLQAVVEGLERLLRRHGIVLPPRYHHDETPTMVEATLRQGPAGDDQ